MSEPAAPVPFRDAEAWLAERGVQREPIGPAPTVAPEVGPPVTAREAVRLAGQVADDAHRRVADAAAATDPEQRRLEDDVTAAVAFIRRSTAAAPQAEGRLRRKLAQHGTPAGAIELALERARAERLVDDAAMAAAFVAERRQRGHAAARIRRDLDGRGFDATVIDAALATAADEDPEAVAFDLARRQAERLTGLPADAAYRRVVGHLVRRGHPDGLARKAARQAVFASRDQQRNAER